MEHLMTIFLLTLAFNIPIIILFAIQNFLNWKFLNDADQTLSELKEEVKEQIDKSFKKMY
jgi:hypothetical protein